jgi:hypothetical protein
VRVPSGAASPGLRSILTLGLMVPR